MWERSARFDLSSPVSWDGVEIQATGGLRNTVIVRMQTARERAVCIALAFEVQ